MWFWNWLVGLFRGSDDDRAGIIRANEEDEDEIDDEEDEDDEDAPEGL